MFRRILICAMVFALASGAALAAPAIAPDKYPVVDGSTATLPLSYALRAAATGETPDEAAAHTRHSKTTQSFYTLIDGASDLLLVYEPSADAYAYAASQGVDLLMKPIGRDALVFLVNAGNRVTSLTNRQVLDIYTGAVGNWKELGGDDLPIVAFQRVPDSGSQVMMQKQVMKGAPMAQPPAKLIVGEMGELIDEVASFTNEPSAIGYSVYYYVHNMYIQDGLRVMPIDGVAPDNDTIASGEYPYTQDFYAVIRADAPQDSPQRQLFDWLGGEEARELLAEAGYAALVGAEERLVSIGE
ncbi:MAG: phosphate ABC transporter substrate-binding protein [Clostridiales bacterium]|nr:phosphate ABC transporter substrate-binding protein [Clostridiales bacterium]